MSRDKLIERYWIEVKRITEKHDGLDKYPITSDEAAELPQEYREAVKDLQAARCSGGSLQQCRLLCERLGNPQERYKIIHVAGTNGKGSVCHKIVCDLVSHGIAPIGEMTSPHLFSIRERMKISGVPISVCEFLALYTMLKEVGGGMYRWFSAVTTMAFFYFAAKGVEVAVVETGIGGRMDATNIIRAPLVTVVTSIGFDHMHMLGTDIQAIAKEKAEIFKPGSPAVVGPHAQSRKVFEDQAIKLNVPELVFVPAEVTFESADRENARIARAAASLALKQLGQTELALALVASVPAGREQYLTSEEIVHATVAVAGAAYPPPKFILIDVGHNVTAVRRLCQSLKLTIETKQTCNKVVFCLTLSLYRTLSIFEPILEIFNEHSRIAATLYLLPCEHSRCRDVSSLIDEMRETVTPVSRSLMETMAVWQNEDLEGVVSAAFREACSTSAGLVFLGSFFSVEHVSKLLMLSFSMPSRRQSLN